MTDPASPQITPSDDLRKWKTFYDKKALSFPVQKILKENSKLFAMGSCFAMQIRRAMAARGLTVYPNYASVQYDHVSEIFDMIPKREALSHYDTFSICQEFEMALGSWPDRDAGFWPVADAPVNQMLNRSEVFQDPYRKLVYATTKPALVGLSERINEAIRVGLEACDIVVLTLGLTEVWQHKLTGRYICKAPRTGYGGGKGKAQFKQSTFAENYNNMCKLLDLLFARYPTKQVIISVSPVALGETYSAFDVGTANTESKAILRAVAGQICREYENVNYFPAYEMAMILGMPTFAEDGRHVRQEVADWIVNNFIMAMS